ncbi:hypothetical protein CK219_05305 [Mesorhizobium sp. WSM4313]|nr:hypothetical protein CK219_05305 [Mesorhizobium sp. WSM4313]
MIPFVFAPPSVGAGSPRKTDEEIREHVLDRPIEAKDPSKRSPQQIAEAWGRVAGSLGIGARLS